MTPVASVTGTCAAPRSSSVRISTPARRRLGIAALVVLAAALPATVAAQEPAAGDEHSLAWPERLVLEGQMSAGDAPLGYYALALDVAVVRRLSVTAGVGLGPSDVGMGGRRLGVMPRFTLVELGDTALSVGLGYSRKNTAVIDTYRVADVVTHVETRWDPAHRVDGELSVAHRFASGLRLRAFAGVTRVVNDGDTVVTMRPAAEVYGSFAFPTAPAPAPSPWSGYVGLALGFGTPRDGADPAPLSIKGWYGWQILAIDLPSIFVSARYQQDKSQPILPPENAWSTVTAHAAVGTFVLGGPMVHLAHNHGWRAAGSLAARVLLPIAVFVIAHSAGSEGECVGAECDSINATLATAAVTSALDVAFLSWR